MDALEAEKALFEKALAFVLIWEGGFVDNPHDHGGATNKGITQATYDAWRHKIGQPQRTVKEIHDDEARNIYMQQYWAPLKKDMNFPENSAMKMSDYMWIAAFDMAVNSGVYTAELYVRRSMANLLIFLAMRLWFYKQIVVHNPHQIEFLSGWTHRLQGLCNLVGVHWNDVLAREDKLTMP
jgi:hypothetical protein